MLTILFNLPSQPPASLVGYPDFRLELAFAMGWGVDTSQWATAEFAELYRRINEANRWVQLPGLIPGEVVSHVWSHMRVLTTLATVAAQQAYDLPSDFGSMHGRLTFSAATSYPPILFTGAAQIEEWNAYGSTLKGRPTHYATRWQRQTAGLNQRQQLIFWPTPDAAYTIQYRYDINPPAVSESNPYVLGGVRMAQLMLDACRAIGESVRHKARGAAWAAFMERLQAAIQLDKRTLTPPTVGVVRSGMRRGWTDDSPLGGFPTFQVTY